MRQQFVVEARFAALAVCAEEFPHGDRHRRTHTLIPTLQARDEAGQRRLTGDDEFLLELCTCACTY